MKGDTTAPAPGRHDANRPAGSGPAPAGDRQADAVLGAFPIAAAIVARDAAGAAVIVRRNAAFHLFEATSCTGPLLACHDVAEGVAGFLAGARQRETIDWSDGEGPACRHFTINLARLPADGGERCLVSLLDRTAEVESQRSLRAELLHDSLTGLPNRIAFEEAVEGAVGDGPGESPQLAVLVVDLARFSRINECMGSVVGDELIITFARRLVGAVRNGDILARIGGDEFGLLMTLHAGEADVLEAALRIQRALQAPFRLSDLEIRVDCAIGCALAGEGGQAPDDLIRNAQLALKRAKDSRQVEIYQRGEVTAVRRRFSIETELRRAIENGQLALAFQPLMDLRHGGVSGFEALARWEHPDRGPISPVEFIPVAEECGLIVPLGRWALHNALATLAAWDKAAGRTLPLAMSVNVSPWQIARDDMAAVVGGALDAHGIAGSRLTLEITESAIIQDPARAMRVLRQLARHEITVAMDDFGTGYSSLAYLQKLPIHLLKIDRSFVTPMLADRDSVAIVRTILGLAESLGMRTTAEGVETRELAQTLAALGCSYGQGYHYARPLPVDAALAFWREAPHAITHAA